MLVAFDAISQPMKFVDCDEVADGVAAIQRGWGGREIAVDAAMPPAIRIRNTSRGYLCVSPRLSTPSRCREKIRPDVFRAIGVCHTELIYRYIDGDASLICLHAGAVETEKGLLILAGTYRSGKSTLVARLAAAGLRIFCDDVLPIDAECNGVSLGFVPRVRLPLPTDGEAILSEFVKARQGPRNNRNLYMDMMPGELAPLGTRKPIVGIVVLDRDPEAEAELVPIKKSEALKRLVVRNIAHDRSSLEVLDRLHRIAGDAACFKLRYATCDDAPMLLRSVL